ncbi:hypothetical protein D3C86_2079660 [compost metagenome]
MQADAVQFSPEVIHVIMPAEDTFDILPFHEGCEQTRIHLGTAHPFVIVSVTNIIVPQFIVFLQGNMQKSK